MPSGVAISPALLVHCCRCRAPQHWPTPCLIMAVRMAQTWFQPFRMFRGSNFRGFHSCPENMERVPESLKLSPSMLQPLPTQICCMQWACHAQDWIQWPLSIRAGARVCHQEMIESLAPSPRDMSLSCHAWKVDLGSH